MQSVVPLPSDITKNELRAWIKQDTWTDEEAILLLHGKAPRNPWLSTYELSTRFVKATVHVEIGIESRAIGERGLVNGREQWIDMPTRWYEWASEKISVPDMVRSEFLEHRYVATPRLHYIRAKDVLLEIPQCSPEEIAMWLFADELIAWHGDEPETRRFTFEWLSRYDYDDKGPVNDDDYKRQLTDIYFSAVQLEEFEPVERWMTYQDILDRWAASMTETEAVDLIMNRAGTADLSAAHPLLGLPQGDEEPTVEDCMFPLSRIEIVEDSIGIDSHRTATGLISAERDCRGWLEGLMRNGPKEKAKEEYRTEALNRFSGLSIRSFESAWKQAITNTGKVEWSRPGRRSKRRIDTPK